jgi:hypothetical protein
MRSFASWWPLVGVFNDEGIEGVAGRGGHRVVLRCLRSAEDAGFPTGKPTSTFTPS